MTARRYHSILEAIEHASRTGQGSGRGRPGLDPGGRAGAVAGGAPVSRETPAALGRNGSDFTGATTRHDIPRRAAHIP